MTDLGNLAAYFIQATVLLAAGALLPWILRVRQPGLLLPYYQALLVACLLLPVAEPWQRPVMLALPAQVSGVAAGVVADQQVPGIDWEWWAWFMLAAGAALRSGDCCLDSAGCASTGGSPSRSIPSLPASSGLSARRGLRRGFAFRRHSLVRLRSGLRIRWCWCRPGSAT